MTGVAAGLASFLAPLAVPVAVLLASEGPLRPSASVVVATCLALSSILFISWLYGLWAFHIAEPSARARRSTGAAPRINVEWSASNDFPDSFAPLIALQHLVATGEGVTGDLVDEALVDAELEVRPGRHFLRVSARAGLELAITERQASRHRLKLSVKAGRKSPDVEAVVSSVVLQLPCVRIDRISEALDGLWDLWDAKSGRASIVGQVARMVCVLVLRALESLLPIHLSSAEGTAWGDDLLFFFSGRVGPIPFVRVHLPPFIIPRLHAVLSELVSEEPLVGQSLRKGQTPPTPHPRALASWHASVDLTIGMVGVNGTLRVNDGSVTGFSALFEEDQQPLRLKCEVAGSLDNQRMKTEVKSFSALSETAGLAKGLRGTLATTLELAKGSSPKTPALSLPEVLWESILQKELVSKLDVHVVTQLEAGSKLPSPVRLSFSNEHPLMLGGSNITVLLEHAALHGTCSVRQELPMHRKRDLLVLPEVDLHFEAETSLDEDKSFMDDGFVTAWLQDVVGTATGRLWSDAEDSVRAEAAVKGSGRITAEVRDSSLVQALIEAEAAASRIGGGGTSDPSRALPWSAGRIVESRDAENEVSQDKSFSVRPGDCIHVEVRGTADTKVCCQVHLDSPGDIMARTRTLTKLTTDPTSKVMLVSLAGSVAKLELGEARARVGDLAASLPPKAQLDLNVKDAEINAEGIGRTHLFASWKELGRPVVQHTAKQISAKLPPLPSTGVATVHIGDMGQVSVTLQDKADMWELANRILDDKTMYGPFLTMGAMLNLEVVVQKILNFARVVRNVIKTEGIREPGDAIPADRMARILARVLSEIGTDGQAVADEQKSPLEKDIYELVLQAVDGKGIDVTKTTRLLWDYLPEEACEFVQRYTAEVDFAIKWFDSILLPTEKFVGPDMALAHQLPPSYKYRRELEEAAPCASRLYEAAMQKRLPREMELQLHKAAPYLSLKQIEFILRRTELHEALHQRLLFLAGLKRRVDKVAEGYGGPAFMPQGMAVGFFLASAIRASFATQEASQTDEGRGNMPRRGKNAMVTAATRLAPVLREQRAVMAEITRLQEYQQKLVEEAASLMGIDGAPGPAREASQLRKHRRSSLMHAAAPKEKLVSEASVPDKPASCMLDALAPSETSCILAKSAIRANAALTAQKEQATAAQKEQSVGAGFTVPSGTGTVFDLGNSLLGPADVAVLLQSGLAAAPQGRQVQQNQRMLLEIMVSQPPLFLKGVLYELSNGGSSRVLSNHLLALLDLRQDALHPHARLDVADLLATALGIQMPRRADFMAGGSHASNSYILFVNRAAKQVLEECEPYEALKYWLRRSEVSVPMSRSEMVPAVQRAVESAIQAIKDADTAGQAWLQERGPIWAAKTMSHQESRDDLGMMTPGCEGNMRRARMLFETAFARCASALKTHPEVLCAPWFKEFWGRNYDALTVVSVLRNLQQDIDETRRWAKAQVKYAPKCDTYEGPDEMRDEFWQADPQNEARCIDCLIEILFWDAGARERYRRDSLMQLIIDEPPGDFNFTVVSAMGVITEGAAGKEMSTTHARLRALRGVEVVRADTATLETVDNNAAEIVKAVRERVHTPWGWVGYSQGCANAFRAEAMMLQGTPQGRRLMENFRCRQCLFSAANGSAHATCGDWKILRALVDGERFLKRFQASMSASTQHLALELLRNILSSHGAFAVLGSVQSLTHEGARRMWRDSQHCHRAPTTEIRGCIEEHTLPECLKFVSNVLRAQMEYSQHEDTQVAIEEAVGYPTGVKNANAGLLEKSNMPSAVQRTHHWSPLKEEAAFLETAWDREVCSFDTPKDRHIFPWLEVNARFGVIDRRTNLPGDSPRAAIQLQRQGSMEL